MPGTGRRLLHVRGHRMVACLMPHDVELLAAARDRKLQREERWMGEAFGDEYAKYRSEVYALIPFVI